MKTIYLDNNATTAVLPEALEAALPFLREDYFNPSSMYEQARRPAHALRDARATLIACLGAEENELLFTSGATESNNAAIFGALQARPERRHLITCRVEHPAVLEVCREAERRGCEVTWLEVDRAGRIDIRALIDALRPDTALVSLMHANNETGVVLPIAEWARVIKETDPAVVVHTDATQTVGKLPMDLRGNERFIDLLSFSGHKFHAPKGAGGLFVRKGAPWRPYIIGGHQQGGRRAGTENVAGIVAMAVALEAATAHLVDYDTTVRARRDRLESELARRIPWVEVNGAGAERMTNTLNISCHYIEGEGILYQLNESGICASSGSACTSGSLDPSHVLKAMGVPFTAVHGSVRFSLSRFTTDEEIDTVIRVFPDIVERLRKLSPYWDAAKGAPRPGAPIVER